MRTLSILCTAAASLAAAQNPAVCDLSVGESCPAALASGRTKSVRLVSLREHTEPYFESMTDAFCEAVVRADVEVDVDGMRAVVAGGPFRLPQRVNGVNVLVTTTKGWLDGVVPDVLAKDVRLEVKDAAAPFYDPGRFIFPVRNYRWRVSNYQHTWLGLAVNQAQHYYHRGEDMGMIPDLDEVLSMSAGTVNTVPGPKGDNASNTFIVEDPAGLAFRYSHMNAPHIRQELQPGVKVALGEKLGLTGNTWRGRPVSDPHLHVDVRSDGAWRNSFPIIVNAYQTSFPGETMPVAGGWRHVWAGGSVDLDGSLSIAGAGRRIRSFGWTFTDGTRASGVKTRRTYPRPGGYSEQLQVTDDKGTRYLDFLEIFVLDRNNKKPPPFIWMNYYPIRGIRAGTPVRFLTRFSHTKDVTLDFGDGTKVPREEMLEHRYAKPGTYVVTATGADAGSGPAVFKLRVVVE